MVLLELSAGMRALHPKRPKRKRRTLKESPRAESCLLKRKVAQLQKRAEKTPEKKVTKPPKKKAEKPSKRAMRTMQKKVAKLLKKKVARPEKRATSPLRKTPQLLTAEMTLDVPREHRHHSLAC